MRWDRQREASSLSRIRTNAGFAAAQADQRQAKRVRALPVYLGRVLSPDGRPVGTCFQVTTGVLATAWRTLDDIGAGDLRAVVSVAPLGEGRRLEAIVAAIDPHADLAVLRTLTPWLGSIAGLSPTAHAAAGTRIIVSGLRREHDPAYERGFVHAPGTWVGSESRNGEVLLGTLRSQKIVQGMSGAPVRARDGDLVVGVVSSRYNSADGWRKDAIWVARTERLGELCRDAAGEDAPARGSSTAGDRIGGDRHDVFLSHASEDNETVARPLATLLRARGLAVWHDETALAAGDRLAESIDRGLVASEAAIVILSQSFLAKRWTMLELSALLTRETAGAGGVVLPVLHGCSYDDVVRISPLIAERIAPNTRSGLDVVADQLEHALRQARIRRDTTGNVQPRG